MNSLQQDDSFLDRNFIIRDNTTGAIYNLKNLGPAEIKIEEQKKITMLDATQTNPPWIEIGKEIQKKNEQLLSAAEEGNLTLVRALLEPEDPKGIIPDINVRTLDEYTPLHLAVSEDYIDVVDFLLSRECQVDPLTSYLRTPLHIACIRANIQIIQLLIEYKANINAQDKDGKTPLHILAEGGRPNLIEIFLKYRPNLIIKNSFIETPYDVAATIKCKELLGTSKREMGYVRTIINNMIIHNNRADVIKSFLFKSQLLETNIIRTATQKYSITKSEEQPEENNSKYLKDNFKNVKIDIISTIQSSDKKPSKMKRKEEVRPEEFVPIQLLGRGTYGEVYLAQYKKTKKYYAIKILSKELISKHNLVKYARTERNILSYSKHPFIVGIEFAFQNPESLFLVLEYCPGGDMARVMGIERKLSETRARTYAAEVLLGLEALHNKGFIFRDLKPGNIVLDEDGHALLTDFGLSKEASDYILNESFCGTPAYMAPEVLNKSGHGKAIDWYHFGTFIYEMLVGIPPYFTKNTY